MITTVSSLVSSVLGLSKGDGKEKRVEPVRSKEQISLVVDHTPAKNIKKTKICQTDYSLACGSSVNFNEIIRNTKGRKKVGCAIYSIDVIQIVGEQKEDIKLECVLSKEGNTSERVAYEVVIPHGEHNNVRHTDIEVYAPSDLTKTDFETYCGREFVFEDIHNNAITKPHFDHHAYSKFDYHCDSLIPSLIYSNRENTKFNNYDMDFYTTSDSNRVCISPSTLLKLREETHRNYYSKILCIDREASTISVSRAGKNLNERGVFIAASHDGKEAIVLRVEYVLFTDSDIDNSLHARGHLSSTSRFN